MITALRRDKERNRIKNLIELDGNKSKCCMKVDAYEILIYHTDISYLPLSEMGHMVMLHLN